MQPRNKPPEGWELQVNVPDYGPGTFDIFEGMVDVYESRKLTKDGQTFVYGSWTAEFGLEILIEQNGVQVSVPSGWAARQLAELLFTLASQS